MQSFQIESNSGLPGTIGCSHRRTKANWQLLCLVACLAYTTSRAGSKFFDIIIVIDEKFRRGKFFDYLDTIIMLVEKCN